MDSISLYYHETINKDPAQEMRTHFHNSHEIIYIVKGEAQFKIGDAAYTCKEGSLIFLSNLEKHERQVTRYPYFRYFLLIDPDYFNGIFKDPVLSSILKQRPLHFSHLLSLNSDEIPFINEIFSKIMDEFTNKNVYWESATEAYIFLLIADLYRNHESYFPINSLDSVTNTVISVQKFIDENSAYEVFLKDVARKFNIDSYYLSHLFKKITGYTFKEYLIRQRLSKAKALLAGTSKNITEVCIDSGFNNVNHFIRIFKSYENNTPYQYRKMLRQ